MSALAEAAVGLVAAMNKSVDEKLPEEIAGVVKLHAGLAVGSAWVPIPGVDVAAGAASIWTMYFRINDKIGIKFGKSIIQSVASGVATNLGAYVVSLGVGEALKFIPGIGSVTGAIVESAALYAITLASGCVYLKALTAVFKKGQPVNGENLSQSVESFLKDNKSEIKNIIKEAKKEYKKEKQK